MDSLGRTAPNTTAPRWEWRAFDVTADQADRLVAPDAPAEETEETYLIGGLRGNAKLRGGLLDVKVLRDVDAAGLERWEPILKAGFPVSGNDVARAFDALEVPTTASSEGTFTASTLLEAASRAGIRALVVRKRRRRATVGGCMAEVVDLRIDDRPTISVAIESEDAEAVERVVRTSGWDPRSNTSYPRGLAALATRPRRVAVIDVGTNSVKFHVAEASPEGWRTIVDRAEVTRLGGGMGGSGRIADDALARTAAAIADIAPRSYAARVMRRVTSSLPT